MRSKIIPKEDLPVLGQGKTITFEEELPFPYVHYPSNYWFEGAFFAFQETKDSPLFYCSCQKKGIEIYLSKRQQSPFSALPVASYEYMMEQFSKSLQFKDHLCHICNKVPPRFGYYKHYGKTKFFSVYMYYIFGLAYEYGINPHGKILDATQIPSNLVPMLITTPDDHQKLDEQSYKDFMRYCENVIRCRMGYFPIGEKWSTEIHLLKLVKELFPHLTVIHQYELDHLKADIFIEEYQLVIEYQGEQHFKPFPHMGGEEGFRKRQEKDKEKIELCKFYNLGLLYFTYEETLTKEYVKNKIEAYLKENGVAL